MTSGVQAIEAVGQQVHSMMEQVLGISFPLFSKQHASDWAAVRASFASSNQEVQGATRALIDTSFRSANTVESTKKKIKKLSKPTAVQWVSSPGCACARAPAGPCSHHDHMTWLLPAKIGRAFSYACILPQAKQCPRLLSTSPLLCVPNDCPSGGCEWPSRVYLSSAARDKAFVDFLAQHLNISTAVPDLSSRL